MTTGQVRIFDQADLALGPKDEALLYDSGVVAWTPSGTSVSVADAIVPAMPLTSNFQTDVSAGPSVEKTNKPIIIVTPTAATGAWTVTVRITTSRS